ncbi:hypothetical protein HXX76_007050 [Chlamydomonas incerta]|uniref:Peptidase M14 domain-containing protein n=1 Tax=Chlamydomonas incerta TaxID=51695 RepID=A0A835TBJ2_CHLIN|nr:hypothetical protein HXX76_007050 [Chlamydomonas incerta]|eukprot:KAG2435855.1 hypothetical protein HXX76_007050 [Chlamydomonas incerta]
MKETGHEHVMMPVVTITNPSSGLPPTEKSMAVLVFGEHARELITCEVGLWMSRVLVGDTADIFGWAEWATAFEPLGITKQDVEKTVKEWVKKITDNLVLKVIPIENVDGRQAWEAGNLCLRKTAHGVDLNRNYPFGFANEPAHSEMYGGPFAFSEPQSRMITRLATNGPARDRGVAKAYVNVHSGEWAVYSGWDSKAAIGPGLPGDMGEVLLKSGDVCRCQAGPAGAVSNYLAYGTGMDFMYTQLGVPYALTYEVYGSDNAGLLGGRKNQPLESFPFANDDRIAKTVSRPDDIFPKGLGHHQHHSQHQKQHRATAHAARARRRSAWEQQPGAEGAGLASTAAGDDTAAEARGSGADTPGWRRRAAALRRMYAKRGAEGEGAAIAERFRASAFGGAGDGSRRLRAYTTPRYGSHDVAGEDADVDADADGDVDAESLAAAVFLGSDRHAGGRGRAALEAQEAEVEVEAEAEGSSAGAARTLQAEAMAVREDAILTMVRSRPEVLQRCFDIFNPPPGPTYRDVVARWVVILLYTLDHVADPANPKPSAHPLPGTVLAGAGAGAGAGAAQAGHRLQQHRRLMGAEEEGAGAQAGAEVGAEADGGRRHGHARNAHNAHVHAAHAHLHKRHSGEQPHQQAADVAAARSTQDAASPHRATPASATTAAAGSAAAAAGGGSNASTSWAGASSSSARAAGEGEGQGRLGEFEARLRRREYEVDPVMRQHSLVVFLALCCLGAVFVPWLLALRKLPSGGAGSLAAGGPGAGGRLPAAFATGSKAVGGRRLRSYI